jgi:DNA ligase-1
VVEEIEALSIDSVVFDGELCIVDEDGNEQFQGIVSQFSRKDHQIENPRYKIFDWLTLKEFTEQEGTTLFSERHLGLNQFLSLTAYDKNILDLVPQIKVESKEHLEELREEAKLNEWEGIMIRLNMGYKGKRTNDLLKCKKFYDAEYVVESMDVGPFRVIVNGKEVSEEVLTNINIIHKGYSVSVGSGFSLEQRRAFKDNPNLIVGKEITVCYFEETTDKHGNLSLRFPTFKAVYDGKRTDVE